MDSLNNALQAFHFIRPWWLLGLPLLALCGALLHLRRSRGSLDDLVDSHLREVVIDYPDQQAGAAARILPWLLPALLILALAGPAWERLPQPLYQLQQGRVVVLSLSKTMDRSDLKPSRLQRAKFKVSDLIASMPGVLNGLVAFAGEGFVVAPLSDDRDTINNLLQSLASDTLPVEGKRADRGLEKARDLLKQVAIDQAEIILVTDQASPLAVNTARRLARTDIRVSVLEVAAQNDQREKSLLESIAKAGKGIYTRISNDDSDIDQLNTPLEAWTSQSRSETADSQRKADQWRDTGPWLLLPILLLASLVFRRGLLGGA